MVKHALVSLAALILAGGVAATQESPDCFSKFTNFNVCEKAREMQRGLSPLLPMKMNANITLSTVSAVGPRIAIIAVWHMQKSDVDASLFAGGTTLAEFRAKIDQATQNSVCSQAPMAAFVRLGGQVQYIYKTEDQHVLLTPTVTKCPN